MPLTGRACKSYIESMAENILTKILGSQRERDLKALVPAVVDRSQEEITLALEMLVRAYDPCISCSVH